MKHLTEVRNRLNQGLYIALAILIATVYLQAFLLNQKVSAALITNRTLTLSSSSPDAGAATTTYTLTFTLPSNTVLQSFDVELCTTASGACTTPTGFSSSSSTISQPTNLGDASGWTVSTADSGKLALSKTGNAAAPTGSQTVVFNNVQNPTTANSTFFGRMTSYSDDSYTTAVDTGVVAASTSQQISLTGTVDETLVFCTGTSGTGCGDIAGSSVDFGTFSSASTNTGTSLFGVSTNGVTGYSVTINGSTLTCTTCSGSPTIAALASQTASTTDTAQFGVNLKDNATPNVGAEVTGTGSGIATANYGTVDQFRFVSGDSVAATASATNSNFFTVSYIVNIPGAQPAGIYTSTMTFIATATF
jgi:hypothetical protein